MNRSPPTQNPMAPPREPGQQPLSEVERCKNVYFCKSGDHHFSACKVPISRKNFRSFDALLTHLSRRVPLPFGVRSIHTPGGIHGVSSIEQLEDGKAYVCSDRKGRAKPVDLSLVSRRPPPWHHSKPDSAKRRALLLSPTRKRVSKTSSNASTVSNNLTVRTPKKILVMKNGDPQHKHVFLLNRRTAQSFENVLDDIAQVLRIAVQKLFTVEGKKVDSLQGVFSGPDVFVAAGREGFKPMNGPIAYVPHPPSKPPRDRESRATRETDKRSPLKPTEPKKSNFIQHGGDDSRAAAGNRSVVCPDKLPCKVPGSKQNASCPREAPAGTIRHKALQSHGDLADGNAETVKRSLVRKRNECVGYCVPGGPQEVMVGFVVSGNERSHVGDSVMGAGDKQHGSGGTSLSQSNRGNVENISPAQGSKSSLQKASHGEAIKKMPSPSLHDSKEDGGKNLKTDVFPSVNDDSSSAAGTPAESSRSNDDKTFSGTAESRDQVSDVNDRLDDNKHKARDDMQAGVEVESVQSTPTPRVHGSRQSQSKRLYKEDVGSSRDSNERLASKEGIAPHSPHSVEGVRDNKSLVISTVDVAEMEGATGSEQGMRNSNVAREGGIMRGSDTAMQQPLIMKGTTNGIQKSEGSRRSVVQNKREHGPKQQRKKVSVPTPKRGQLPKVSGTQSESHQVDSRLVRRQETGGLHLPELKSTKRNNGTRQTREKETHRSTQPTRKTRADGRGLPSVTAAGVQNTELEDVTTNESTVPKNVQGGMGGTSENREVSQRQQFQQMKKKILIDDTFPHIPLWVLCVVQKYFSMYRRQHEKVMKIQLVVEELENHGKRGTVPRSVKVILSKPTVSSEDKKVVEKHWSEAREACEGWCLSSVLNARKMEHKRLMEGLEGIKREFDQELTQVISDKGSNHQLEGKDHKDLSLDLHHLEHFYEQGKIMFIRMIQKVTGAAGGSTSFQQAALPTITLQLRLAKEKKKKTMSDYQELYKIHSYHIDTELEHKRLGPGGLLEMKDPVSHDGTPRRQRLRRQTPFRKVRRR